MIRVVICCRECGLEYDEEWKEGKTDVIIKRKGYCDNCCKLDTIFDVHKLKGGKRASIT